MEPEYDEDAYDAIIQYGLGLAGEQLERQERLHPAGPVDHWDFACSAATEKLAEDFTRWFYDNDDQLYRAAWQFALRHPALRATLLTQHHVPMTD